MTRFQLPLVGPMRTALAIATLLTVAACSGTHPVAVLLARNESNQTVTLTVTQRATGILTGPTTTTLRLAPWTQKQCPAAAFGVSQLPLTVTVNDSNVAGSRTKIWDRADTGSIVIRVDATEIVHFDEPAPSGSPECQPYEFQ